MEYRKLRKYNRLVSDKYSEHKSYINQLKILAEALHYSTVGKDDVVDLIFNNIFDLYHDAMEFDNLVNNYIDLIRS
ncbi:MAG: hypothetical protein K2G22_00835 [Eubacterium sp.]|nr:hypothetical protein [Eubacterium sp.]